MVSNQIHIKRAYKYMFRVLCDFICFCCYFLLFFFLLLQAGIWLPGLHVFICVICPTNRKHKPISSVLFLCRVKTRVTNPDWHERSWRQRRREWKTRKYQQITFNNNKAQPKKKSQHILCARQFFADFHKHNIFVCFLFWPLYR